MEWLQRPTHAHWLETESQALLDFGARSRVARGFGYLDDSGVVEASKPLELYVNARMTHCFSLGAALGWPAYGPLADHGLAALGATFADREHGGWFTSVATNGDVDASKQAYAHSFVVLAAASAALAGRQGGEELLAEALRVAEEHFWQEAEGAVVESFDRSFTTAEPYRGVNANMHTVEAYLAAADASGDDVWLQRAYRMTERVIDGYAREHEWRIPEHFTAEWQPLLDYNAEAPTDPFRPFGATVGHWLEWARLILHVRAALGARGEAVAPWLLESARSLFDRAVAEGWAVDGAEGFVYTVDFRGAPVVHARMHWVVCEAIAAAAALYTATGERRYGEWYARWWEHAASVLIEEPGAWRHELDRDNSPAHGTWAGKPDIYHALQATLLPRLPLAPGLTAAVAGGWLDTGTAASH